MGKKHPLSIIDVDTTNEGVIITFSNGTVTLFHTSFLHEVRAADGNVALPPMDVERSSRLVSQDNE